MPAHLSKVEQPVISALKTSFHEQALALMRTHVGEEVSKYTEIVIKGSSQKVQAAMLFEFTLGSVLGKRIQAREAAERCVSAPDTTFSKETVTVTFQLFSGDDAAPAKGRGQNKGDIPSLVRSQC